MNRHVVDPVEHQPELGPDGVLGSRCGSCERASAPTTHRCPWCGSTVAPAVFVARGTVWASTVVHLPRTGRPAPQALAYVDLDEGPRVLVVQDRAETWAVGTPVDVVASDAPNEWAQVTRDLR